MRTSTAVCLICTLVLAVFLKEAVSLPPDFFRNGRGGMSMSFPPHKKSTAELDLIASACQYCGTFNLNQGYECRRANGEIRKMCILEFLSELQNAISENGWQV